jgi:hypothetical protein
MLHKLLDLSKLLDSAPVKIELRRCNLITLVRLHDEVRQFARSLDEPDLAGQIAAYAAQ